MQSLSATRWCKYSASDRSARRLTAKSARPRVCFFVYLHTNKHVHEHAYVLSISPQAERTHAVFGERESTRWCSGSVGRPRSESTPLFGSFKSSVKLFQCIAAAKH